MLWWALRLSFAGEPSVVSATPFALSEPYLDAYRADHPAIVGGSLVTLAIAPGSFQPRAVGSPVLYAGDRPVAVAARGDACLVAIVPSTVNLTVEPMFWGPTALPERVTPSGAAVARDAVVRRGVKPALPMGFRAPATVLQVADEASLYVLAARQLNDCR
jgi:hypothetical protein